eukprot:14997293-Alexandrium_andersonii.AAC.1
MCIRDSPSVCPGTVAPRVLVATSRPRRTNCTPPLPSDALGRRPRRRRLASQLSGGRQLRWSKGGGLGAWGGLEH